MGSFGPWTSAASAIVPESIVIELIRTRSPSWTCPAWEAAPPTFSTATTDSNSPDPFELTAHREALARLVSGIDDLPEKMQQVLSLYYCENMNLKEIGQILGVTESRVCQIHGEATRRLRESLSDIEDAVAA